MQIEASHASASENLHRAANPLTLWADPTQLSAAYHQEACTAGLISALHYPQCWPDLARPASNPSRCPGLQADAAIAALDGTQLRGQMLEVKHADADAGAHSQGRTPSDNLYIRGMPPGWSDEQLAELFAPFGGVKVPLWGLPPRELSEALHSKPHQCSIHHFYQHEGE